MSKINLDTEIADILAEYTTEIEEGMQKAKQKVARDGAKTLRQTSPKLTGDYAKGWTANKIGDAYFIRNRTRWMLTHLLEKGHAKVGGGRVAAIPHIYPVEQEVIKEYEKEVEKVIKG